MNRSRPIWISVMMLVLSILYLIPETIFNSQLVAVAGGRESTEADLRVIEYFGRTVSGVGATLLIADLLLKGRIAFSKGNPKSKQPGSLLPEEIAPWAQRFVNWMNRID